ncbi:MAG TPA: phosphate regulon transcriptional regulatory protein PhoB [Rhodospirillales bacterium]|nr:phosphate regulon transcriptional regulatory protein PhoB [Rhodospirillales bacterium]
MASCILVVEDEPAQSEMISYNLKKEGFQVVTASDGQSALDMARDESPDLVLLDWMLPEIAGIEVCRQLRANKKFRHVPIIMVSARGEEDDRVRGIDTGADDYLVKPYSPRELIARINALLRRSSTTGVDDKLICGDLEMDLARHKFFRDGISVHLGPTEFKLLRTFMERPGHVFSRERLLDLVWGQGVYVEDRTVDVHIRRLRKAVNEGDKPDVIRTVRAVGYALDLEHS